MRRNLAMRSGCLACLLCLVCAACSDGCGQAPAERAPAPEEARAPEAQEEAQEAEPTTPEAPSQPAEAEEAPLAPRIEEGRAFFPAQTYLVGSPTGTPLRRADREADDVAVQVPAFDIDLQLFSSEGTTLTQVTPQMAQERCASVGRRLCHEIEWELACTSGAIEGMGQTHGEWTASAGSSGISASERVFRGAAQDSEAALHRCESRRGATQDTMSRHLAIRCCGGEAPAIHYPEEDRSGPAFADHAIAPEALREQLGAVPELRDWLSGFALQTQDPSAPIEELLGWTRAAGVLEWRPQRGDHLWVIAGRSDQGPMIFALYVRADGSLMHAASYAFEGETRSLQLAYASDHPTQIRWAFAWNETGDNGFVELREDGTIGIRAL